MNIISKQFSKFYKNNNKFNDITSIISKSKNQFSEYFREQDRQEMKIYNDEINMHPFYKILRKKYMDPMEKKKKRNERIQQIQAIKEPIVNDIEKFVVHNPVLGIEYPPKRDEIFAVIEILGKQYKVVSDDLVIADYMPDYKINDSIVFDQVYLVGTQHYTSIGRPLVSTAKVYATIEEQTYSEKTIVFKYKRRKGYKKSQGSSVPLTVLRIEKIEHILDEQLQRATSLI